jgi:hypothetical protein
MLSANSAATVSAITPSSLGELGSELTKLGYAFSCRANSALKLCCKANFSSSVAGTRSFFVPLLDVELALNRLPPLLKLLLPRRRGPPPRLVLLEMPLDDLEQLPIPGSHPCSREPPRGSSRLLNGPALLEGNRRGSVRLLPTSRVVLSRWLPGDLPAQK